MAGSFEDRLADYLGISKEELEDQLGLMESDRMDRAADYVQRGRSHAGLSDAALAKELMGAMQACLDGPFSRELVVAENDLRAEFDLRGSGPPKTTAMRALEEKQIAATKEYLEDLIEYDPEGYRRLEIQYASDLVEFIVRRKN